MALLDGLVEVVEDGDSVRHAPAHGVVVEGGKARRILLDAVAGELRLVEIRRDGAAARAGFLVKRTDTSFHRDIGEVNLIVDRLAEVADLDLEPLTRHEEREVVS